MGIQAEIKAEARQGSEIEKGTTKELSLIPVDWLMKRIAENKLGNVGSA